MKKILLATLCGVAILNAETSAFGAGNLTSNSPYGLTSNEKFFKEKLDNLNSSYTDLNLKINSITEQIEGLKISLEGLNSQYSKLNTRVNRLEEQTNYLDNNFTKELNDLRAYVEENRKIQETNNKQVKKVLSELNSLIISMNNVSQQTYLEQNLINDIIENNVTTFDNNTSDNNISNNNSNLNEAYTKKEKKDDSWKKQKSNEILKLAIKELNENEFEDAKEKFEYLIVNHYKPARSTFYLGEIEYKQQRYNNAIVYYKKSSAISVKGDYVPKLLYHTAISLDKIGDPKSANNFYRALKTNYPNTPEAKASPDRK